MNRWMTTLAAVFGLSMITGCGYDTDGTRRVESPDFVPPQDSIDTDVELTELESGVGMFIEYFAGGTWQVRFGCDTDQSGFPCLWTMVAQTLDGSAIRAVEGVELEPADDTTVPEDGVLVLQTVTEDDLDGVRFRVAEGTGIGFDLWLEGSDTPNRYVYWVSAGALNQGIPEPVFDLVPSEP